jgi:hypothetical protein
MLALINNPLTTLTMVGDPAEAVDETMLRTRLMEWACNLGDPNCTAFATAEFKKWMDNPTNNT